MIGLSVSTPRQLLPLNVICILVCSTLLCWVLSGCDRRSGRGLNPGDFPPKVSLIDLSGNKTDLSSFKGKVVLLNFWASWCAPCMAEMPELQGLYSKLRGKGFEIVAVGLDDSKENIKRVKEELKLDFHVLFDETGASRRAFGLTGFPESFLLDANGKVQMILDPGNDNPVVRIVGPRDWNNEVTFKRFLALTGTS